MIKYEMTRKLYVLYTLSIQTEILFVLTYANNIIFQGSSFPFSFNREAEL